MQTAVSKYVFHEEYGEGEIINGMRELDQEGNILSVDVMFEHGIVREVPSEELIQLEEGRGRPKGSLNVKGRKNEPFVKKARAMPKPKDPDEDEDEKDAYPEASSDGKHVINALGGILDRDAPTGKVSGHTITKKKAKELHTHLLGIEKPEERAMQSAQVHSGTHPMMKEDVVTEQKEPPMSVDTAATRFRSVEEAVRNIIKTNNDVRKTAKEEEFKSNNPHMF